MSACNAAVHSVIGTSSLRRAAQLRCSFPHLQIADVVSFVTQLENSDLYVYLLLSAP